MLYLNPPYHIINGVTVLPDHSDPRQYYFMPANPRLTRLDGPGESGAPVLQLIKFRSQAGSGGILDFDVHLGVEEDLLADVAREIRSRERMRDTPRMAPIPLVDGTVRMMMLGRSSDPEVSGSESGVFQVKFSHYAKPSLYGANQAAFSVELNPEATTLVEEALQGEVSPIGIIYSLSFWGLIPAYHVRLNVDWNRVQTHLSEQFTADTIIFSSDISTVVDELMEERIIELEVDSFVPEGDEDFGGVEGRKDRAVNQVREMITETFFQPSLDPIREDPPDGWDRFTDTAESLALIGATGGLSGLASFSYKSADIQRLDRKTLNVNMRERTTVVRSIHPQGHLTGLWRSLREDGFEVERFIRSVDLNDPWYQKRSVRVIARTDFKGDSIASVQAELDYHGTPRSALLESGKSEATLEWPSKVQRGAMFRPVTGRYRVRFQGVEGSERPRLLESGEVEITSDVWEVDPRDLFEMVEIPIVATNFPWDRYNRVEIYLQYDDPENGIRMDDVVRLTEDDAESSWRMFLMDPSKRSYRIRIVYRSPDHRDVEGEWRESDDPVIPVRDPFPRKRTVELVPAVSWEDVDQVFVDLTYRDPANDIHRERSLRFSESDAQPAVFEVDLVDPEERTVEYRVTLLFSNGRIRTVPPSETRENRIFLRSDMVGHRVIRVRPGPDVPLGRTLREMVVTLSYEDPQGGLSYQDEYRFQELEGERFFEFDYVDENRTDYRYRTRFQFTNGMSRQRAWITGSSDVLVVPGP